MIYDDLPIKMVIFPFATLNDHIGHNLATWDICPTIMWIASALLHGERPAHRWDTPIAGWFLLWKKANRTTDDFWGYPHDETEMPKNVLRSVVSWYLLAQLIQLFGILSSSWRLLCGERKRCLPVNVLSFITSLYLWLISNNNLFMVWNIFYCSKYWE